MEIILSEETHINIKDAFKSFLTKIAEINSSKILLFTPTKTNFQVEWIKEIFGKSNFRKLMHVEDNIEVNGNQIYFRSYNTLKKNRILAENLSVFCFYPNDKEIDTIREITQPKLLWIFGDKNYVPETRTDHDFEVSQLEKNSKTRWTH